jgi:hypothetical protein
VTGVQTCALPIYLKESDPERLKAYRHQAYINRKAKLQAQTDKKE